MDIKTPGSEANRQRVLSMVMAFLVIVAIPAFKAHSTPYADPGDEILRHDLEYLVDRGLINIPITSWPVMWADVNSALVSINDEHLADPTLSTIVYRLRQRVLDEIESNIFKPAYRISGSDNSQRLRVFENTPRSSVELEGEVSLTTDRFASRIRLAIAGNARDDKIVRLDGTFVARIFGNTAVSLGWQDKWWGPGWSGALGLSSNARPVPGLLVQRNFSEPFNVPVLKYLGPWSYQVTMGIMESNRAVPNPYLFGMRVIFKPVQQLELGLSRTAQWGGQDRIEDLDSFLNMLLGRDNEGSDGLGDETEPGNQLAGFDARWTVKRGRWPVTVYGQLMGEDEAGGFPSKYLGQFGVSTNGSWGETGTYVSARAEYSDTTCQFNKTSKNFDCAYNNSQFPTGYRYRGQAIGHSTDNDTSQVIVNAQMITVEQRRYSATVRIAKLNRGGSEDLANSLTSLPRNIANIDLTHERPFRKGVISLGVGYDMTEDPVTGDEDQAGRLFVEWSRRFF